MGAAWRACRLIDAPRCVTESNGIKVKKPQDCNAFRERVPDVIKHFHVRGFCVPYGDLRRQAHAAGVPMQPSANGEILEMNCGAPSYRVKDGLMEEEAGPRLVLSIDRQRAFCSVVACTIAFLNLIRTLATSCSKVCFRLSPIQFKLSR